MLAIVVVLVVVLVATMAKSKTMGLELPVATAVLWFLPVLLPVSQPVPIAVIVMVGNLDYVAVAAVAATAG